MVVVDGMHSLDIPLFDVISVGVGQIEEPFGEMPDDGVLIKELLIVEPLGEVFTFRGRLNQGRLIGEDEFLSAKLHSGFREDACFPAHREIEQQDPGIQIERTMEEQEFTIMVRRPGIFVFCDIDVIEKVGIAMEHDIAVEVEELIRHIWHEIR